MKPRKEPGETPKKGFGIRPPDAVVDARIAEACAVLAARPTVHRCQLHAEFAKRWGCHWRTIDRILVRARALLMERLQRSREDFRAESLAFYEALTADPHASVAEKTRARQRIDELLGLDAPTRQELSGSLDVVPVAAGTVVVHLPAKVPVHSQKLNGGNGR